MPANISITDGPDKGMATLLRTGEVNIGRGAGCQFVVSDEGFDGQLRVSFENGTYWATNRTEHVVYVWTDNRHTGKATYTELAPGGRQVWHSGDSIQMTDRTTLLLTVEAAGEDDREQVIAGGGGPVVVTRQLTPEQERKARDRRNLIVTLLCVPITILLFAQPNQDDAGPTQSKREVETEFEKVVKDLAELDTNREHRRPARIARKLIQDARMDEAGDYPYRAIDQYAQARDTLDRALGEQPTDDRRDAPPTPTADADSDPARTTLRAARDFTVARLVELTKNNKTRPK